MRYNHFFVFIGYRQKPLYTQLFVAAFLFLLLFSATCFSAESYLAKQTLAEINLARKNPKAYADFLKKFRRQFRGGSYLLPGTQTMVGTNEGVKAVDEAIRFLSRQKPLPPLAWSTGLSAAAAELAEEEGVSGAVGHFGRASSGPKERIERHAALIQASGLSASSTLRQISESKSRLKWGKYPKDKPDPMICPRPDI